MNTTLKSKTLKNKTWRRWTMPALIVVLGGGLAVAAWAGGNGGLALALAGFYLVCCAGAYLWSRGRGDVAAVLASAGDERQRQVDLRASAVAGGAALAFCLAGGALDLARGGTGNPWVLICAVGGVSYLAAFAYFRNH
jgi:hypothetical protein